MENNIFLTTGQSSSQRCPRCNMSFSEYRTSGLLGCPVCYRYFYDLLVPSVRKVQFQLHHQGKFPTSVAPEVRSQRRTDQLKEELKEAVAKENFERAAELRDEIHALEKAGGD